VDGARCLDRRLDQAAEESVIDGLGGVFPYRAAPLDGLQKLHCRGPGFIAKSPRCGGVGSSAPSRRAARSALSQIKDRGWAMAVRLPGRRRARAPAPAARRAWAAHLAGSKGL